MDDLVFTLNVPSLPIGLRAGFPNLAHAVERVAQTAHAKWLSFAAGEPVPGHSQIGSRTGAYLRSIKMEQRGELSYRVFSDAPHAKGIEEGSPGRDLKQMLLTSRKIRVVRSGPRKGTRYLIIPFQWGTPGTKTFGSQVMTSSVHRLWKSGSLRPSAIIGMGQRMGGYGHIVPQRRYDWGDRLQAGQVQNKHMVGMVNFRTPGGRGGAAHSQYLTFRVMAEDSKGWIAKAVPGRWPARTTVELMRPLAEKEFKEACEEDVRIILRGTAK